MAATQTPVLLALACAVLFSAQRAAALPPPVRVPLPVAPEELRPYLSAEYERARQALLQEMDIPPVSHVQELFGAPPPELADALTCQRPAAERAMFMMMGERIRMHLQHVVVVVSLNTPDACAAIPRWWSFMRHVLDKRRLRFIVPAQHAEAPPCQALSRVVAYTAPPWKPRWRPGELAWMMHAGFLGAVQDLVAEESVDGVLFTADDVLMSPWFLSSLNLNRVATFPHGERPYANKELASIIASQTAFVAHVFDSASPPPYAAPLVPSRYAPGTVTLSSANQDVFYMPQRLLLRYTQCLEDALAWGVADFCIAFSTCQKAVEHESLFQLTKLTRAWHLPGEDKIARRIDSIMDERVDYIHPCKVGKNLVYAASHALYTCMA